MRKTTSSFIHSTTLSKETSRSSAKFPQHHHEGSLLQKAKTTPMKSLLNHLTLMQRKPLIVRKRRASLDWSSSLLFYWLLLSDLFFTREWRTSTADFHWEILSGNHIETIFDIDVFILAVQQQEPICRSQRLRPPTRPCKNIVLALSFYLHHFSPFLKASRGNNSTKLLSISYTITWSVFLPSWPFFYFCYVPFLHSSAILS